MDHDASGDAMKAGCLTIAVFWIACGIFNAGADNAYWRGRFPDLYTTAVYGRDGCADSLGRGLVFGPVGAIMSPFMTGFFQYGWTLSCGPVKP